MPRRSKTKVVRDRRTKEVRIYSYPYKSMFGKGSILPEGRIGYFRKNMKPFILDSKSDYSIRSPLKIRKK
jgi:hypothetical protein